MTNRITLKEIKADINTYCETKTKENELSKITKKLGTKIKDFLTSTDKKELENGGYKVYLQEKHSVSFDEEKLISLLEENGIEGVIKIEKHVDEKALERALYDHKVSEELVNSCKIDKVTQSLYFKEVK